MRKKLIFTIFSILIIASFAAVFFSSCVAPYRGTKKLIDAIESGDKECIQALLEDGVDPNQASAKPSKWWALVEYSPKRPISVACYKGDLEIVQMLISYGATAEFIEYTGWSPLRETLHRVDQNDLAIIKLLLENGADATVVEADISAVFAAADMWPAPRNDKYYGVGYDETVAEEITQMVVLLLGNESVDAQTVYGQTLLMYAARRGNLCLAEYLLEQGCNTQIRDNQGKTALDYAVDGEKQDMIMLLAKNG